jgi:hypothetical protein
MKKMTIDEIAQHLSERFAILASDDIYRVVLECHADFDGRPIQDYVPILVERAARDRLNAMTLRESAPTRLETSGENCRTSELASTRERLEMRPRSGSTNCCLCGSCMSSHDSET